MTHGAKINNPKMLNYIMLLFVYSSNEIYPVKHPHICDPVHVSLQVILTTSGVGEIYPPILQAML